MDKKRAALKFSHQGQKKVRGEIKNYNFPILTNLRLKRIDDFLSFLGLLKGRPT